MTSYEDSRAADCPVFLSGGCFDCQSCERVCGKIIPEFVGCKSNFRLNVYNVLLPVKLSSVPIGTGLILKRSSTASFNWFQAVLMHNFERFSCIWCRKTLLIAGQIDRLDCFSLGISLFGRLF